MIVVAVVYLAGIFVAVRLLPANAPLTPLSVAIVLVPGIAVLGFIWSMARLLIELDDEYLRLLEVRKFIVATAIMLALASVWGLLELLTAVPRVPLFYAFPVWALGLAVGGIYNRITMGDGGCG
jgi:hypothetical protein